MSTEPGTTTAQDELPVSDEQRQIPSIEAERPEAIPEAEEAPPAAVSKKEEETPSDHRSARLEALAARARDARQEEAEVIEESMVRKPAPKIEEPATEPERMIKLKVRGEIVELPESEVIARAQKVDAADSYLAEAKTLRDEVAGVVRAAKQDPTPEAKQEVTEKVDRISKAIELIQTGGDPAEAKAILETELSERAKSAATEVLDTRTSDQRASRYDEDYNSGFSEAATDFPDMLDNPVGRFTVRGLAGALQANVIAEHLTALAPEVQQAFAASGITPDALRSQYSPEDAAALYKDMLLKGYRLPYRPSQIVKVAAQTVAERFGATKPTPAPTPEAAPLDRTARKEAITQPERTPLPKTINRQPVPRTEPQRAASARQELRANRRKGSA